MGRAVEFYGSAELAVLNIMHLYDFSMSDLYQIRRARVPASVFLGIVRDLNKMVNQYGPPHEHRTEEARSRYLSPGFGSIIAHFKLLIQNVPETLEGRMNGEGRMNSRGRIEYQFRAFGALSILFIKLGTPEERMDKIAQRGYGIPIQGILTDGDSYQFFTFIRNSKARRALEPLIVKLGMYHETLFHFSHDGSKRKAIYNRNKISVLPLESFEDVDYVRSLRPVCEAIYWTILRGFIDALTVYRDGLIKSGGCGRQSTSALDAKGLAEQALATALGAADPAAKDQDYGKAEEMAQEAWALIAKAVEKAPSNPPQRVYDFETGLTSKDVEDA
ncbi:hypothetical protein RUND412_011405 [Rhizina undulata]